MNGSIDEDMDDRYGKGVEMMYEEEILDELRTMNQILRNLERLLLAGRDFGGSDFAGCLTRIMYGVEE